jgi:hypothetical protein
VKKLIAFFCLLTFCCVCFSQASKASTINDDNVNLRSFPSIKSSFVLLKLSKNAEISLWAKTRENDDIGLDKFPWYYVSTKDGNHGWVYGKYVSEGENKNYQIISINKMYRNMYADQLIQKLLGNDVNAIFDIKQLENYKRFAIKDTSFWQMKESGFVKYAAYETDFGTLTIYLNERTGKWKYAGISISKENVSDYFLYGISLKEWTERVGSDYSIKDNKIEYDENEEYDKYVYYVNMNNDKIVSYEIWKYFD